MTSFSLPDTDTRMHFVASFDELNRTGRAVCGALIGKVGPSVVSCTTSEGDVTCHACNHALDVNPLYAKRTH
jgi:hypothetical protein